MSALLLQKLLQLWFVALPRRRPWTGIAGAFSRAGNLGTAEERVQTKWADLLVEFLPFKVS